MAKMVLNNAYLSIAATDLSTSVKSCALAYAADAVDLTSMATGSSTPTRTFAGGVYEWSIDAELFQDYAGGSVDATLWPLVGMTVAVEVRAFGNARSATNPGYSGMGLLERYQPVGGSLGEAHTTRIRIRSAGTLSRLTS